MVVRDESVTPKRQCGEEEPFCRFASWFGQIIVFLYAIGNVSVASTRVRR